MLKRHDLMNEVEAQGVRLNQVATFLSSPQSTGLVRWLLYQMAYPNPFRRPFHATFGDGRPITSAS